MQNFVLIECMSMKYKTAQIESISFMEEQHIATLPKKHVNEKQNSTDSTDVHCPTDILREIICHMENSICTIVSSFPKNTNLVQSDQKI